jgi:hypothetical protein
MKHIFFIFTILLGLFSCKKDVYEPKGIQGDTIKLSADKLFSPAKGGEFEITTKGQSWIVYSSISVDSKWYEFRCDSVENNWYWIYNDIEFPIEKNGNNFSHNTIKIEGPWFIIHKVNQQKIIFTVFPNDTGKDRTLILNLNDRNFFTGITLTQSAD